MGDRSNAGAIVSGPAIASCSLWPLVLYQLEPTMSADRASQSVHRRLANRFGHDHSGTVAPIFGLVAALLILSVGITIDYARTIEIQSLMQSALDSAAMAASAADVEDDDERRTVAAQMFAANYPRQRAAICDGERHDSNS